MSQEQASAPAQARPVVNIPDFGQMKKKKRVKRIIVTLIVLALVLAALYFVRQFRQNALGMAAPSLPVELAAIRDISVSISGSSAVKAANSYVVTTLISGEILSSPFEEGDTVDKDDVLYTVDSSDLLTAIERAELTYTQTQNSLSRKRESLSDLNIQTREAGTLVSLPVKAGDSVVPGQVVAVMRDSATMVLTVPFGSLDAQALTVGQQAEVTLDGSYESLPGVVTEISRIDRTLTGNMLVRDVKIDVSNPGGITPAHTAMASAGGYVSNSSGAFAYKSDYSVTAALAGKITRVNAGEGDILPANTRIITLESQTLELELENASNSLRDAELNLNNQRDKLESYTITSPISGTIIEKNYKTGDTLEAGRALCTIFDLNWLELTLNIDELDIHMVSVGQEVEITAGAAPGKSYRGVVTKVNINGSVVGGVTSYPVTIRVDQTDGLLPGMNVDATILVKDLHDVLAIPAGAVMRGNRVLVRRDENAVYTGSGTVTVAPEGFELVTVTLGESDGDYVQVLEGISEGDAIVLVNERPATQTLLEQFGGRGSSGLSVGP